MTRLAREKLDVELLYVQLLSLVFDGLTGGLQEKLVAEHTVDAHWMMYWTNLWSCGYMACRKSIATWHILLFLWLSFCSLFPLGCMSQTSSLRDETAFDERWSFQSPTRRAPDCLPLWPCRCSKTSIVSFVDSYVISQCDSVSCCVKAELREEQLKIVINLSAALLQFLLCEGLAWG